MIPSPIAKVLSIFRKQRVRALLMGGQACILYGAAEFSRDIDLAVLATDKNLEHLRKALADLRAEQVFVPALQKDALLRGHASHFRAGISGAEGIRIDVMSVLHGCAPFEALWTRRTSMTLPGLGRVNVLSLPDLVEAKKTQRDKDWPMIRRLVEADYYAHRKRPSRKQLEFWLREARTPAILMDLCHNHPRAATRIAKTRPVVAVALKDDLSGLEEALRREEEMIRAQDKEYWRPLRAELGQLWRERKGKNPSQ